MTEVASGALGEGASRTCVFREMPGKVVRACGFLLQRFDGTLTGNATEIDAMVREAWDPVFRKYAKSSEPDWTVLARRFGRYLHSHPMQAGDFTAENLKEVLGRM